MPEALKDELFHEPDAEKNPNVDFSYLVDGVNVSSVDITGTFRAKEKNINEKPEIIHGIGLNKLLSKERESKIQINNYKTLGKDIPITVHSIPSRLKNIFHKFVAKSIIIGILLSIVLCVVMFNVVSRFVIK